MDRLDERLRHGLKRLSEPVAAGPILESVVRRKSRKRLMRRVETAGLVVVVVIGTLAGTYGLLRVFGTQGPRPAFRPEPTISAFEDLPRGWTELPPPPEFRDEAATVWTGDRLISWGGIEYSPDGPGGGADSVHDGGFVFSARTGRWTPLPPSPFGPLGPRRSPGSAWTGREMLIWGGQAGERRINHPDVFGTGAAYDPVRRSWRLLPEAPISPRAPHSVWTGREFILWGTSATITRPHRDGAAYDPSTNSWRKIADAPIELTDATAVWTGQEMIVFGASLDQDGNADTETAIGAAYDPESDSWRRLPDSRLAPRATTAAWTGRELVAWDYDQRSAAYDPVKNRWRTVFHRAAFCDAAPISVAVTGYVVGSRCGPSLVLLEPGADRWRRLRRPDFSSGFGVQQLLAADPAVLVLATDFATDETEMLAHRPTGPEVESAPAGQRVTVAQGKVDGQDWKLVAYQTQDGLCVDLFIGRQGGGGCGFGVPEERNLGIAIEFDGRRAVVHGLVSRRVDSLKLSRKNGSSIAIDVLETRRFDVNFYVAFLPPDISGVLTAFAKDGMVLERHRVKVPRITEEEVFTEDVLDAQKVTVYYPQNWRSAEALLAARIPDGEEVASVGTYELVAGADECPQIPERALEQLGPQDALVSIQEISADVTLRPRPKAFSMEDGEIPPVVSCLDNRDQVVLKMYRFEDQGRSFRTYVAFTTTTPVSIQKEALRILNSFLVCAPSSRSGDCL